MTGSTSKSLRNGPDFAPPGRRFSRRKSEMLSKRTLHQASRRNSLFASVDQDLEAAAAASNFKHESHGRRQRLSSIISIDDEEEDLEQEGLLAQKQITQNQQGIIISKLVSKRVQITEGNAM